MHLPLIYVAFWVERVTLNLILVESFSLRTTFQLHFRATPISRMSGYQQNNLPLRLPAEFSERWQLCLLDFWYQCWCSSVYNSACRGQTWLRFYQRAFSFARVNQRPLEIFNMLVSLFRLFLAHLLTLQFSSWFFVLARAGAARSRCRSYHWCWPSKHTVKSGLKEEDWVCRKLWCTALPLSAHIHLPSVQTLWMCHVSSLCSGALPGFFQFRYTLGQEVV